MLTDSGSPDRPLRVGVLLDSLVQPAWIDAALSEIQAAGELELALIVLDAARPVAHADARRKRPIFSRAAHWALSWRQAPYWAYIKLDNRLWPSPEDPFRPIDLTEKLLGIPTVRVNTVRKKFSDWFPDEAVEAILAHRLDVAQRFGFRILKGRALEIAHHGVWSFHHGDYLAYRGGPAGFWEVLDGTRQTGMLLQRLTEDLDDGAPIASVFSRTDMRSVELNRRHYYPLGPKLLAREFVRLQRSGPLPQSRDWSCYSAPLYVDPRPSAMTTLGARLLVRTFRAAVRRFTTLPRTGLSLIFRSDAGGAPHGALYRSRRLAPPPTAQWLDPCAWVTGTQRSILVSEKTANEPAHLALLPVEEKSVRVPGLPIYAETGGDVRSPAPFTWHDTPYIYLTIDGAAGIRLLRCLRWPDYWELADTIFPDLQARSVAIAEIGTTWWLFVGAPAGPEGSANLLNLYHAAEPFGPWVSHALNPVRLGDDGVCPAGPPFSFADRWYRPARDPTVKDGCCVAMMRIEQLDPDVFRETRAGLLQPDPKLKLDDVTSVSAIQGLTVFGTATRSWRVPWRSQPPDVAV